MRATEYQHWEEVNLECQCDAHVQTELGIQNINNGTTTAETNHAYACVDDTQQFEDIAFAPESTESTADTDSTSILHVANDLSTIDKEDDGVQLQSMHKGTSISLCQGKF